MRYPHFLACNGNIGFVAPSFGCATEPYKTAFGMTIKRFEKEGYGRQRSWIREGKEDESVNEPDKDGFTKLTKAEQLELPFDLTDREKC